MAPAIDRHRPLKCNERNVGRELDVHQCLDLALVHPVAVQPDDQRRTLRFRKANDADRKSLAAGLDRKRRADLCRGARRHPGSDGQTKAYRRER